MKKHSTIIMILFFFMGLLVLLYPAISDFHNQKVQSRTIVDYESILKQLDNDKYDNIFTQADDYNSRLRNLEAQFMDYKQLKDYKQSLDINGNGMMGYISIDKIKVELPIYHGTKEDVLSNAVGHLEGTSLPVGGQGTHSVLSAHRGLASSTLFTNLDKLEIGDTFTITVLDKLITYEIDNIKIVKPNDTDSLMIEDDKDYVTLVTCTPYGINTHRLLVRGKRIENAKEKMYVTTEAYKISTLVVTPMIALPIILILLIVIALKPSDINFNIYKEKYVYPDRIKIGGKKNEKN